MCLGDLGDFQQSQFSVVLDQSATLETHARNINSAFFFSSVYYKRLRSDVLYLHISARLVRHLHDELASLAVGLAGQVVQDVEVDSSPQVVDVGHKDVLLPLFDQLIQQAGVVEAGVDVAVAWRVPALCVMAACAQVCGHGEEGLLVNAGVPVRKKTEKINK